VRRVAGAWLPAVAWAAVIYWFSSLSTLPVPQLDGLDKVEHFTAYGLLAYLSARGCAASRLPPAWGLVLACLYGVSDELHQAFVPGRSADVFDWMADAAGAAAALYLYHRRRSHAAPSAAADGDRADAPFTAR
jgi:VanZ family protein